MKQNRPWGADRRRQVTLFLCGDVMTGRGVDQVLPHPCDPELHERSARSALGYVDLAERANGPIPRPVRFDYIWGEALAALAGARPAARIVNLETSITTSPTFVEKGINYRMHPANAPVLQAAGIHCCVLANNHILDFGEPGLIETLDTLAASGIEVAGAGRDAAAASTPAILPCDFGSVLVFACGTTDSGIPVDWRGGGARAGVHVLLDLSTEAAAELARIIRAAKRPGDIAIVSIHWGGNWGYEITAEQRRFAHMLVEAAGIDLVHGHSSHHPKAVEVHEGHLILNGCGDFIDDYEGIRGYEHFRADLVVMYFPIVEVGTGRLVRLRMVPLQIRNYRLSRPVPADRTWLFGTLERECRRLGQGISLGADEAFLIE